MCIDYYYITTRGEKMSLQNMRRKKIQFEYSNIVSFRRPHCRMSSSVVIKSVIYSSRFPQSCRNIASLCSFLAQVHVYRSSVNSFRADESPFRRRLINSQSEKVKWIEIRRRGEERATNESREWRSVLACARDHRPEPAKRESINLITAAILFALYSFIPLAVAQHPLPHRALDGETSRIVPIKRESSPISRHVERPMARATFQFLKSSSRGRSRWRREDDAADRSLLVRTRPKVSQCLMNAAFNALPTREDSVFH